MPFEISDMVLKIMACDLSWWSFSWLLIIALDVPTFLLEHFLSNFFAFFLILQSSPTSVISYASLKKVIHFMLTI